MEKAHKVELTSSYDDWLQIRECFVKSFRHYALYKYMIPEERKRDAFLRKYFEANYDVTVGVGKAILLSIKAPATSSSSSGDRSKDTSPLTTNDTTDKLKIIGGVMFLLPADNNDWGWMVKEQEPFDDAYDRHGLEKISPEGLARLKRYENWENKLLEKPVKNCGLPMWNAIFCAISPEYTNMGICSMLYESAIAIMADYWLTSYFKPPTSATLTLANIQGRRKSFGNIEKNFRNFRTKGGRRLSETLERPVNRKVNLAKYNNVVSNTDQDIVAPLVLAVSHSDRSASFHKSNGFSSMQLIPFYDEVDDVTPFYVHILAHEPFRTGNLPRFDASVRKTAAAANCQSLAGVNVST